MFRKLWAATAIVCVLAAGGVVTSPSPASASLACSATRIKINGQYIASGHAHLTGNHYVYSISGNIWTWYSDNYGGRDGDSNDSYYGKIAC